MQIGVPQEDLVGETRVSLTPGEAQLLVEQGHDIVVERGAGVSAGHPDDEYRSAGARIAGRPDVLRASLVLQVRLLGTTPADLTIGGTHDLKWLQPGTTLIGVGDPLGHPEPLRALAERGVSVFSLDLLPRITRAQAMDVLSSQSSIAGYRAALIGAGLSDKVLPMMTTAAGTLPPARVLVLGAGVAGLQAIATARRLGAVAQAYDVRSAAREQVESVGGTFVDVPLETAAAEGAGGYAQAQSADFLARQREVLGQAVAAADVVIATAQVPGRPAPELISEEMVRAMRPGSVIVDAAAAQGGNCALSVPDETVEVGGVVITAPTNLPAAVASHASRLFARNIANFTRYVLGEQGVRLDTEDPVIHDTLLVRFGEIVHPQMRELLGLVDAPAGIGV